MKNSIQRINLWQDTPPSVSWLIGKEILDPKGVLELTNVTQTELIIYSPTEALNTGTAVIICPGGAYLGLAITSQGYDFAEWLTTLGITGIVLKYRMPNGHSEIPLDDVMEAFDYVKHNANRLGISANKIGIVGFSAGGHLAATFSTLATQDSKAYRLYFSILFYPVISMEEQYRQVDTFQSLLGETPTQTDIDRFSCEKQVSEHTPPTLLFVSTDDQVVLPANSELYYQALKKEGVSVNLHQFSQGDHAWGIKGENMFGQPFEHIEEVKTILQDWLKSFV